MAKGGNNKIKEYWQEMIADMQEKIKGNREISLEYSDIAELNAKTNIAIGTLNGYFGLDSNKVPATYPNVSTRDILAKEVLEISNWNEYVRRKQNQVQTVTIKAIKPEIIVVNMDNTWDIKTIRTILTDTFNDTEFVSFCMSNFWGVYDTFGDKQDKAQKITALIDYCARNPNEQQTLIALLQKK